MNIPTYTGDVPWLTSEQMMEVDRAMIEDCKIELIQMMDNAGRNLAHLARLRFLDGDPRGKDVTVLPVRQAAWYRKKLPIFADTLALVRQQLWPVSISYLSSATPDMLFIPKTLFQRLADTLAFAT